MKVLVVCSFNHGRISTFIRQQIESLQCLGIEIDFFLIQGKGITGYLSNLPRFIKRIHIFKPDLIHAHYGLSGVLSVLQHRVPVITTFHGSDINVKEIRILSRMANRLSSWSVFVSQELANLTRAKKNFSVIPCGIDLTIFSPFDKFSARQKLGYAREGKLVLFSGSFSNKVKNYPLAIEAIDQLNLASRLNPLVKLIELENYSREEVNLLLNACDVALLTSFSEGSPNFIKEALACNRPVVSTDVGDVKNMIEHVNGCFIAEANPVDIANKIKMAIEYPETKNGRQRIFDLGLDLQTVTCKILKLYNEVLYK
jgi:glycosyltransferase involved in cell wall biosynthesis